MGHGLNPGSAKSSARRMQMTLQKAPEMYGMCRSSCKCVHVAYMGVITFSLTKSPCSMKLNHAIFPLRATVKWTDLQWRSPVLHSAPSTVPCSTTPMLYFQQRTKLGGAMRFQRRETARQGVHGRRFKTVEKGSYARAHTGSCATRSAARSCRSSICCSTRCNNMWTEDSDSCGCGWNVMSSARMVAASWKEPFW